MKKKNTERIPVEKNKCYVMKIEDLGSQGEGIGKVEGFTVFVSNALPEDTIKVLIVKVKKQFAYGKIQQMITPSPQRVEPRCAVAEKCGGCQLQHLAYGEQLKYKTKKVKDALQRIALLEDIEVLPTIGMENPWQYRNKGQFPVGESNGQVQIGFYGQRSHRIIDTRSCCIQQEVSDRVVGIVRGFLEKYQIPLYDETSHRGLVRHVLTRVGFTSGECMVCIVLNGKKLPYSDVLVEELRSIEGMTSIVLNENCEKTNVILGKTTRLLWGKPVITDTIGNLCFEISPQSFFQVNPIQTRRLYEMALQAANLQGTETVLDLYCGIGTISLFFAQKAKKVIGVEVVPEAIEDAKKNAERNGITNAAFFIGTVETVAPMLVQKGVQADVVVIDPPRKGCDAKVLQTIEEIQPRSVVYVSCDPATMARDVKVLTEGGYQVEWVQPVDMFPQGVQVETVVLMSRVSNEPCKSVD